MSLVHKLEELVDDSLEEFPVCLEETRVLPDNVHDVGSTHRLVVLASFLLGQSQEVLDDRDQEPLLHVLACRQMKVYIRSLWSVNELRGSVTDSWHPKWIR